MKATVEARRFDGIALTLAIAVEAVLAVAAVFGGPHGALGGLPWALQLPGILIVYAIPGNELFFVRVAAALLCQVALWYLVISRFRRGRTMR